MRTFCAFLICSIWMTVAKAQPAHLNFTSLNVKDGLLSNYVSAIIKDRYGLMWFGTNDGLEKFDGANFTVYRHKPGDSTSLRANDIMTLYEDKAGNLWIGTGGGAFSRYDRQRDRFINYPVAGHEAGMFTSALVRGICSDHAGRIWIAQYEAPYVLDPTTNQLKRLDLLPYAGKTASAIGLYCVFEDSRQRMWVGTDNGLFLYLPSTHTFRQFRHYADDTSSLINDHVRTLAEDKHGDLWIGTNGGLCVLKPGGDGFAAYRPVGNVPTLGHLAIMSAAVDRNNVLWVGTMHGLFLVDARTGKTVCYKPETGNPHSLSSGAIACVYVDDDGINWIGTWRGGVNKYDKNLNLFNVKLSDAFHESGVESTIVTAFSEKKDGDVLVGTDGGGLYLFDKKTEGLTRFPVRVDGKIVTPLSVLALHRTAQDKLYIGTYANGLIIEDAAGRTKHVTMGNGPNDLNGNDIFTIKEDSKGQIWVGTNGSGVDVLRDDKVVTRFSPAPTASSDIQLPVNGYIRAIEEDSEGKIWIGSYGNGLAVYDPRTRGFMTYSQDNGTFPSNKIMALLQDSRSEMWVGTYGGGLVVFDKAHDKYTHYTEQDGLQNTNIYQIVEDAAGRIWVSTNTGISSFDRTLRTFRNFTSYNGLQNNNFQHQSGIRLSDGRLFFGGLQGFNYFDPAELTTNRNVPRVMLTDLKVAGRSVVPGKGAPITDQVGIAREIRLGYKQNFALSFVALNYTIPNQNHYAYKLDGFDTDWTYAGTRNTAYYTNLDPGEYVFRVKASNNDGVWSRGDTMVKIYVRPPIWRTWYAYVLYVLAAGGLLYYSRHRGLTRLQKKYELEQERQETRRIQELDRMKLKFLTNLSHEFRTPISLIMGPVDQLLAERRDDPSTDRLRMIRRNSRRLLNLVNQLLDFRKMEEQELRLQLSEGEFVGFVSDVCQSFTDLAERKGIDFSFETRMTRLYALFDKDKIERILFNLLSNAFKFTQEGGRIGVSLEAGDGDGVLIKVADTGIGIPVDKRERIFERFFQHAASGGMLNQGTGIGLAITREFVGMHGGEIGVESEPGRGSVFTVRLPLSATAPGIEAPGNNAAGIEAAPSGSASALPPAGPPDLPVILLVEDNEDFRFYLKDNLRQSYKVLEAANGMEGWQKALSGHPQLIVSDISMPYMDGIVLTRKLKADKRTGHIPVILLTALTEESGQLEGLKTGANDYITKPFSFELLQMKIKNLLELGSTLKTTYSKQIRVDTPAPEIESGDEQLLKRVIVCIEENLTDQRLSVEFLSRELGMSRTSLYSKLLAITGQTPVEYIRGFKLERALKLLEKSDLTIAEIAYRVGFSTPNYFARAFKTKYNMLPSEYSTRSKKEQQNNNP